MIWRRIDCPGTEHFRLRSSATGGRLEGTVVVAEDGIPMSLRYEIVVSPEWETRSVRASLASGGFDRELELVADDQQRWSADGEEIPAVAGLFDCDLSLTPATNLLAVRRERLLDLPIGEPREVTSTFVLFPQVTIEPLYQRYTRIAERRFDYVNLDGSFETEIEVDDLGLVVYYPPFWERVSLPRQKG